MSQQCRRDEGVVLSSALSIYRIRTAVTRLSSRGLDLSGDWVAIGILCDVV